MINRRRLFASIAATACAAFFNVSSASELSGRTKWPRLIAGAGVPECKSAYAIALEAFMSSDPDLSSSTRAVASKYATIISPRDKTLFEIIAPHYIPTAGESSFRNLFWGMFVNSGKRIVLREDPLGWQYESVSAYVIDENVKPDSFIEDIRKSEIGKERFPPFIREKGDLIIARDGESRLWAADLGFLNATLPNWEVFTFPPSGALHSCSIQFLPKHQKISSLLPREVSHYVFLLSMTLGDGKEEGSLQQTRRIRSEVEAAIATVVVRPWALPTPYNTTTEVENGLRVWASLRKWNAQHYQEIQKAHAPALHALSNYYKNTLQFSAHKANSSASASMDILLRVHYVFHKEN